MRTFHVKADCRGCRAEFPVKFEAKPSFTYLAIKAQCPECQSELEVQVKPGMYRDKCSTRTKMLKHTQKLLDMIGIKE